MSYNYETEVKNLFNEDGIERVIRTMQKINSITAVSGVFTMGDAMTGSGSSWQMLAAVDFLAKKGFIKEIDIGQCAGQDRIFRKVSA